MKCNLCDKLFSSRQSKSMHMKVTTLPNPSSESFLSAYLLFSNSLFSSPLFSYLLFPSFTFSFLFSFLSNRMLIHYSRNKLSLTLKENYETQLVFQISLSTLCLSCPHILLLRAQVLSYVYWQASHAGERPYVCKECGASFPYPRSLAIHTISHRRTNPSKGFACDLCGKVTKNL